MKILILCGGRGTRLKPLTGDLPKPLLPFHGKPFLQHVIEFYLQKGIKDFILCTGFGSNAIRSLVDSCRYDASIQFSDSGEAAGILKRLYDARERMDPHSIVTYGDTFVDLDPKDLLRHHSSGGRPVTLTVAEIRSPFGIVEAAGGRVTSFREKPVYPYYIGQMAMDRAVLEALDERMIGLPDGQGLVELFQKLISSDQLGAYLHKGLNITFNTPQEREQAEREMGRFFTHRED